MTPPQKVAVVGAGTMGLGIAHVCASAGLKVLLFDIQKGQVSRAMTTIAKNLTRDVQKGKLSEIQQIEILEKIEPAFALGDLCADLIIEAAVEDLEVKRKLFAQLEEINNGNAVLATNTSSISVTAIASSLLHPEKCLGMHFFNPADKMKLVEVISGEKTSRELIAWMKAFAILIGKIPVEAKDSPGFIVNRVARHFYTEALVLEEFKITDMASIDSLLRSSGFKMGPFELMDLIGVDTNLAVTKSIYEGFGRASRFKPSILQQRLVNEGRLGRKSGRGFYEYPESKN